MTAMPAQKIGVLAMTNAMEAMRAPMSMTITQVQAAGLLPWPGRFAVVDAVVLGSGGGLGTRKQWLCSCEISSGSILLTFCHLLPRPSASRPGRVAA